MEGEIKAQVVQDTIENLRRIDLDGETMQYIIEKLGMNDQMLRQLVLSNPQSDTYDLLQEHIRINDYETNKIEQMEIKDYVLYDRANNSLVKFNSGDIVFYGNKNEAIEDCYGNEEVIQFENLPNDKQKEIINQLK